MFRVLCACSAYISFHFTDVCSLVGVPKHAAVCAVGAISNCSAALMDLYSQSKKLSDLEAGDWQETRIDKALCKAGLW